ncbi:histone-lysine N-methyltransferase 2B [Neocloeon triangulifer]|uniref:histone-lysine N-methyltransferase 2B n=1 Tax=Neocloeon triangulifer TaxID=2078957 RepID=UPI00286F7A08|nr:histone-lysine N-methyltransferase 2B [Neocloeon triangulifer]
MWSDQTTTPVCPNTLQQVPMTGLQAKRKRDDAEETSADLPALKCGRGPAWPSSPRPRPWPPEDNSPPDSDEDEDDDELEELSSKLYCYPEGASPPSPASFYRSAPASEPYCPPGPPRGFSRTYWPPQYCYQPAAAPTPTPMQTIRCAENGKSYLELGSAASTVVKSRAATYRQQRHTVLNISMCKLSRFRQFPDPSLHRSVLICNTLRRIEREMEKDSQQEAAAAAPPAAAAPYQPPVVYPATPPPPSEPFFELRDLASPAPRATPFPSPHHPGSADDSSSVSSSINWSSVLSLSSQSDLDPLNNNGGGGAAAGDDLDSSSHSSEWRLCSDQDSVLKSLERTTLVHHAGVNGEELVDSLMQVLVGT